MRHVLDKEGVCKLCNCTGTELTTLCTKQPVSYDIRESVKQGQIDYRGGEYLVRGKSKWIVTELKRTVQSQFNIWGEVNIEQILTDLNLKNSPEAHSRLNWIFMRNPKMKFTRKKSDTYPKIYCLVDFENVSLNHVLSNLPGVVPRDNSKLIFFSITIPHKKLDTRKTEEWDTRVFNRLIEPTKDANDIQMILYGKALLHENKESKVLFISKDKVFKTAERLQENFHVL